MVIPEEELEEIKGVIKSSRSKKDRQYNCQKKKDKRTKYVHTLLKSLRTEYRWKVSSTSNN
jgi:hypothetical protein